MSLSTVMANPEPDPVPGEESYDDYEYKEDPVDYGQAPEFLYPEPQNFKVVEGGKVTIPCQLANDGKYNYKLHLLI